MKKIIAILGLTVTIVITSAFGDDPIEDTNTSLCYDEPTVTGFNIWGFGMFNGVTTPIRNTSDVNITDVNISKTFNGINMSIRDRIAIDNVTKTLAKDGDEAEEDSDIFTSFGEFNGRLFRKGIVYRISEIDQNQTHTIYDYSMFSFNLSKIKIGAEYTKNGQRYYAVLHSCDGGSGSSNSTYPTGPFNIIEPTTSINDHRDPTDESDSKNYIYTKVIGQDFNISLLHLADDNVTLSEAYTKDTNVSIDIVNTEDNATIKADIWNHHFTQGEHDSRTEITNLNINKIVRSARFRINITTTSICDDSMNTIVNDVMNTFSGSHTNTPCTNQTTTEEVYSRDTFSIRPYALVAFGKNQYKRAGEDFNITIKAVDKDNFDKVGNSSSSGDDDSNVHGITVYNKKLSNLIVASDFYQPTSAEINQMQTDIGTDNNNSINGEVNKCTEPGNFTIKNNDNTRFTNGEVNASLNFSETGILNLLISEKPGSEWAKIDNKDTDDSLRYVKASTITYNDENISANVLQLFVPYELNATAEYNTTTTQNWVYMNDISNSNSTFTTPKMAAFIEYRIIALNKNGTIVKNYTRKCFPDVDEVNAPRVNGLKLNTTFDLFLDMDLNTTNDTNISLYSENNISQAIWTPQKNKELNSSKINHIQEWVSPFQFENGVGKVKVYFNTDRNISKVLNPIQLKLLDVNTSTSWMTNPGSPAHFNGTTLNQNRVFLYGYAHAGNQHYQVSNDSPYTSNSYYEVYCFGNGCDTSLLTTINPKLLHVDDLRWYQNVEHNTSRDGNITSIAEKQTPVKVTASTPTGTTPTKSNLTYDGTLGYPYSTTMKINASKWLIYNRNNANATSNPFQVEFNKEDTGWGGKHETNTSTTVKHTAKTNGRVMW